MENSFGKNIIPENENERLDALRRYRILDTPPEDVFDYVARLATKIFDVPVSLVSLVDKDEVFFKANVGMAGARSTSRGVSLCSLAVLDSEVTIFENAPEDPCLLTNPNVIGEFGLKFYAGAPLVTNDGYEIGTVCIIDQKPREFTAKEQEMLKQLAQLVMHELELRLAASKEIDEYKVLSEEMATANEEITAANEELSAVVEELRQSDESLQEINSDLESWVSQRTVDLENSENTLRQLSMNAKYSLAILRGENWIIEIANEAIASLWNKSLVDIVGRPLMEVLPEIIDQPFPELLKRVYKTGTPYRQDEEIFLIVDSTGTTKKYVSFAYDPLFNQNNQVVGIIVSANDITDKVNTREQLIASLNEQQTLNEELYAMNEEVTASNEQLSEAQDRLQEIFESVADSEIKFRNIIDQAPVAIAIFDGPEFVIDVYNDKVLEY
jgi:PAS domain-containing protein